MNFKSRAILSLAAFCVPMSVLAAPTLRTDLAITNMTMPATVVPGKNFSQTMTITNVGSPTTVVLTTPVPNYTRLISPPQGCSVRNQQITCMFNAPSNNRKVMSFGFRVESVAPCNARFNTVAQVQPRYSNVIDTNLLNNNARTEMSSVACEVQARLNVVGMSLPSTDTATSNQKNIPLLRFQAGSSNAAVLLKSALFVVENGSQSNIQNLALWVDTNTDGTVDTILQSNVRPVANGVHFNNLKGGGYAIETNAPVVMEVRGDVASSLIPGNLSLAFSQKHLAITAEKLSDGTPLLGTLMTDQQDQILPYSPCKAGNCNITIKRVPSTLWSFVSGGSLFLTKSAVPARTQQLLGGSLGNSILNLSLRAEGEHIDVFSLAFRLESATPGAAGSIDRLELWRAGDQSPFAHATLVGCGSDATLAGALCAQMIQQQLVVGAGTSTEILVRPRLKTDVTGAVSGSAFKLSLASVNARGMQSSNNLSQNNGDQVSANEIFIGTSTASSNTPVQGPQQFVVLSKIKSITNASPDVDGTAIPTGYGRLIGRFKFSTENAMNTMNGLNKFTLTDIIFTVDAPNVSLDPDSFKLLSLSDPTMTSPCTVVDQAPGSSRMFVACWDVGNSGILNHIDPGTNGTFALQASVLNSKVDNALNSSLQVSIESFSNSSFSGMSSTLSHIRWLDSDSGRSQEFWWIESPETVIKGTLYQG